MLGWLMALGAAMGTAQAQDVQNTPIRYRMADEAGQTFDVDFPYLRLASALASARVNALLHHLALQTLVPGVVPASGAAPLNLPAREASARLSSMEAKVQLLNGGRVLRVSLITDGCGAYCSPGTERLDFDARTGRPDSNARSRNWKKASGRRSRAARMKQGRKPRSRCTRAVCRSA